MSESYVVPLFLGATGLATLMLLFVMGVLFVQKNKQNKFKRTVLEARIEAQEKTVNEISRNLHDDVAQLLSHIQMNLNHLESLGIKETKAAIVSATNFLREAMMDVRHMSHTLNSEWLRSKGLVGAIEEDVEHINATNQVRCQIILKGEIYRMKHDYELAIFRITQEIIHNMFKHSKASSFIVALDYKHDLFTVNFTDNGKGFNVKALEEKGGVGLNNMQERAKFINATLQVHSELKNGCRTSLKLPITDEVLEPIYED